jgi:hypothetical protein
MPFTPRTVSAVLGSGLAALGLLVVGIPAAVSALDATSAATPTAVACEVERRDIDELIDLLRSAPPAAQPSEIERLPARQPADAATVAEIERTVRLFEACMNTGDQLLFSSFFSDRMLSLPLGDELAASIETELRAMAAATPTPLPADGRASIIGPWNVQELADGRVLAGVNILGNDEDALDPFIVTALVFVREDGRWLLDEPLEEFIHVEECDLNVPAGYVLGLPPGYEAAAYYGEADGPPCLPLDPDRDRDREDRPERRGERAARAGGTPTAAP